MSIGAGVKRAALVFLAFALVGAAVVLAACSASG
jgi:hypothetical protein